MTEKKVRMSELREKMVGAMDLPPNTGSPEEKARRAYDIVSGLHEHWGDGFEGLTANMLMGSAIVGALVEVRDELAKLTRMLDRK